MGTIRVDERPVILARTTLSHASHQPFGDPSVERTTDRRARAARLLDVAGHCD
jgi:hypothetical protein